jgi:quinol monooxygenase YgiN
MTKASEPVVVIARWTTTVKSVDGVLALVEQLRQRSLEEPGCLGYEVLRNVGAPESIVLIESYADPSALEAHRRSEHYRELVVERLLPLLTGRRLELLRTYDAATTSAPSLA